MIRPNDDDVTVEQLVAGYARDGERFTCLFCERAFARGRVYSHGEELLEAETAMRRHVAAAHVSPFHALLELGKQATGLSDTQRALLGHFHAGLPDREIQPLAGGVSLSTIRNHRFQLREKARQAKVQVALMTILANRAPEAGERFIEIPGRKAADDERFAITETEYRRIVAAHFPDGPDGRLVRFPRKEKRKIAVLIHLLRRFDAARRYAHAEVDEILAGASDDHVTLRRYLVDYGFLGRTRDGTEYWVE